MDEAGRRDFKPRRIVRQKPPTAAATMCSMVLDRGVPGESATGFRTNFRPGCEVNAALDRAREQSGGDRINGDSRDRCNAQLVSGRDGGPSLRSTDSIRQDGTQPGQADADGKDDVLSASASASPPNSRPNSVYPGRQPSFSPVGNPVRIWDLPWDGPRQESLRRHRPTEINTPGPSAAV